MQSNDSVASGSPVNIDRRAAESKAHISSLLSVDPVLAFQQEFVSISTLGYNFNFINSTICTFLAEDTHADKLRALLEPFNLHAFEVANAFHEALKRGQWFYVHDKEEWKNPNISDIITDERAQKLLDPEFQSIAREHAMYAVAELESARQLLVQEVLPRLPDIEKTLKEYVDEYNRRYYILQERSQSWIPTVLQDIIWGANDPITWNISEVAVLPDVFDAGVKNLKKLPDLLNRMRAHFKQLGELDINRVPSLGYTTIEDLHRLYRDRLQCHCLLRIMDELWDPAILAFPIPFPRSREYY